MMGKDKHDCITHALMDLLRAENVSDDKAIMEAYTRNLILTRRLLKNV